MKSDKLHKVFTLTFSDLNIDCYISESSNTANALWLSRETIGKLLGLKNPAKNINTIHSMRKSLFDKSSVSQNNTVFYNFRALINICYISGSKNKDDAESIIWGIVDGILALRNIIDSLDEFEAKEFIASIPDELTFQEFLLLCLKGVDYFDAE